MGGLEGFEGGSEVVVKNERGEGENEVSFQNRSLFPARRRGAQEGQLTENYLLFSSIHPNLANSYLSLHRPSTSTRIDRTASPPLPPRAQLQLEGELVFPLGSIPP